jgi:hypothetical protein
MTEAEWLVCTDEMMMLEFLKHKGSDRKWQLFAVACCRSVSRLLNDEGGKRVIEVLLAVLESSLSPVCSPCYLLGHEYHCTEAIPQ